MASWLLGTLHRLLRWCELRQRLRRSRILRRVLESQSIRLQPPGHQREQHRDPQHVHYQRDQHHDLQPGELQRGPRGRESSSECGGASCLAAAASPGVARAAAKQGGCQHQSRPVRGGESRTAANGRDGQATARRAARAYTGGECTASVASAGQPTGIASRAGDETSAAGTSGPAGATTPASRPGPASSNAPKSA
jgi:hypothetical protein